MTAVMADTVLPSSINSFTALLNSSILSDSIVFIRYVASYLLLFFIIPISESVFLQCPVHYLAEVGPSPEQFAEQRFQHVRRAVYRQHHAILDDTCRSMHYPLLGLQHLVVVPYQSGKLLGRLLNLVVIQSSHIYASVIPNGMDFHIPFSSLYSARMNVLDIAGL